MPKSGRREEEGADGVASQNGEHTVSSSAKRRRTSERQQGDDAPDGVFDMFHFGHARALQQAKQLFPNTHLIVGVSGDEETHKYKGRTVMSGEERCESVRHCRYADEVLPDCPWQLTLDWVVENEIDYVAHGEDPCLDPEGNDLYGPMKEADRFKFIKRTDGVSTSDLIKRIIQNYDTYVKRNLTRGYSRKSVKILKDLNVSYVKEKEILMKTAVEELKQSSVTQYGLTHFKDWKAGMDNLSRIMNLDAWSAMKKNVANDFLRLFGPVHLTDGESSSTEESGEKTEKNEEIPRLDE